MTVFLYAFRERELILDLFEEYCGARLTYNSMRIGGLPLDIPPGWDRKVREFCDVMEDEGRRVRGAADAQPHLARAHAAASASSRARRDRDRPERARRCAARACRATSARTSRTPRTRVRVRRADRRARATPTIAISCGSRSSGSRSGSSGRRSTACPKGPIVGKVPRLIKPPAGETYHAIESPKGRDRLLHRRATASRTSRTGSACGRRRSATCRRCRGSIKGHLVADVVALIGSIDIVLGEVDR